MSNGFSGRLKRITCGIVLLLVIAAASLWVTSWALEPEPFGAAKAPQPRDHEQAIIQVYGADVWGFRGNFAIHTWIATKAHGASEYQVYEVVRWNLRRRNTVVRISDRDPARPWAGSPAILLHEMRGAEAEALIGRVHEAALSYPFKREYKMWPGPNSNSFTAWIGLEVPELKLELPLKAIGQSWMHGEYPALRD
jgi:hypothetical protein